MKLYQTNKNLLIFWNSTVIFKTIHLQIPIEKCKYFRYAFDADEWWIQRLEEASLLNSAALNYHFGWIWFPVITPHKLCSGGASSGSPQSCLRDRGCLTRVSELTFLSSILPKILLTPLPLILVSKWVGLGPWVRTFFFFYYFFLIFFFYFFYIYFIFVFFIFSEPSGYMNRSLCYHV